MVNNLKTVWGSVYKYSLWAAVVWTALVGGSLAWNFHHERSELLDIARREAVVNFNKDIAIRHWAAAHGGVYVPTDSRTPPNPYLSHIPERDIKTPSGRSLTLMNPAYILRQMTEEYSDQFGVRERITSLKPLRAANAPDAWERRALEALQNGKDEVLEHTKIGEEDYFRFMRPLVTKKECLKCHAHQGYKEGDIRGGVGVYLPIAPLRALHNEMLRTIALNHVVSWVFGLFAIGFISYRSKQHIIVRDGMEANLRINEKMLGEALKEWQFTFDSITDKICIIDRKYNILKANRSFLEYAGGEPEKVLNRKCYEIFHGLESFPSNCPGVMTMTKGPSVSEFSGKDKGSIFQVSSFPYNSETGGPAGFICIAKDITAERESEMRLIANERLALLGQMASGIAHEINNPLASIAGCAEGLLKRLDADKLDPVLLRNYLEIIYEEVFRCKKITTEMLLFVREKDVTKDLDINAILDDTLELIGFQGRLKKMELARNYTVGLPPVKGDEGELRQVFLSVITNALDAMEDTGLLTLATSAEGREVIIIISDTGHGIPKEHLSKIFGPFFTTKSMSGGLGLGLSLVQKVIQSHGGSINIESPDNMGVTVRITLPF